MIRLYGEIVGEGSFSRVTAGVRWGIGATGRLAGFVPVDTYDTEAFYEGADAPVAVFTAHPKYIGYMKSIGWHKDRWALLPANSTWMPRDLIATMERYVTGFLAPSVWAKFTLEQYTKLPVSLFRHGVDTTAFHPVIAEYKASLNDYEHGRFEATHLASTNMQRKGTRELIHAWCELVAAGKLGHDPKLRLIVNDTNKIIRTEIQDRVSTMQRVNPRLADTYIRSLIWTRDRWDMDAVNAAHYYRKHHLVCQPSRGEGFGLVPLEALACGVPVLITQWTGHTEYANELSGVQLVPTDHMEMSPIDDGPGALAPQLRHQDLVDSIFLAYKNWKSLALGAQAATSIIHRDWSWQSVAFKWLLESGYTEKT